MVWRCKDIKLSGALQDEQVGGGGGGGVGRIVNKIERLSISEIKKSRSSGNTDAGFPNGFAELIHWCVAVGTEATEADIVQRKW